MNNKLTQSKTILVNFFILRPWTIVFCISNNHNISTIGPLRVVSHGLCDKQVFVPSFLWQRHLPKYVHLWLRIIDLRRKKYSPPTGRKSIKNNIHQPALLLQNVLAFFTSVSRVKSVGGLVWPCLVLDEWSLPTRPFCAASSPSSS